MQCINILILDHKIPTLLKSFISIYDSTIHERTQQAQEFFIYSIEKYLKRSLSKKEKN